MSIPGPKYKRLVAVAPMMDWTDRHFRFFMRLISPHVFLYTEMITAKAIINGDRDYLLGYDKSEHPLALQLGGDDPKELAEAVKIASDYGYDEYNLNVGCPSERVQKGSFGACLMAEPELVARSVEAMQKVTGKPVTVKHRIGIDNQDSYEFMHRFVTTVNNAGCDFFTVHARIAILKGLSPKENRQVPPLRYEDIYRLKQELPELHIEINGGIRTMADIKTHLAEVDSVMIGRLAYEDPFFFRQVEAEFYGGLPGDEDPVTKRISILHEMADYVDEMCGQNPRLFPKHIIRHMMGLFTGIRGARCWRQYLSENMFKAESGQILRDSAGLFTAGRESA